MADPLEDVKVSVRMLERIVGAVTLLSPNLTFVAFPGGQMGYGIYQPGGTYKSPYHETLPRVPPPLGDGIPYYAMRDKLDEMMAGQKWTWCEVCPDAIVSLWFSFSFRRVLYFLTLRPNRLASHRTALP